MHNSLGSSNSTRSPSIPNPSTIDEDPVSVRDGALRQSFFKTNHCVPTNTEEQVYVTVTEQGDKGACVGTRLEVERLNRNVVDSLRISPSLSPTSTSFSIIERIRCRARLTILVRSDYVSKRTRDFAAAVSSFNTLCIVHSTFACVCVCARARARPHIYICVCMYICVYIYIYIQKDSDEEIDSVPSGDKDRVSRMTGGNSRANGDVTESGGGGSRGDWSASLLPCRRHWWRARADEVG